MCNFSNVKSDSNIYKFNLPKEKLLVIFEKQIPLVEFAFIRNNDVYYSALIVIDGSVSHYCFW